MLLDRLRQPSATTDRALGLADVEASIRENIHRILATRQDTARVAGDYGLPDLDGVVQEYPRGVNDLCDRLAAVIERYEPRLTRVRARRRGDDEPHVDPLAICLDIRGRVADAPDHRKTRFIAQVSVEGNVRIDHGIGDD